MGDDIGGIAVHIAARVSARAEPQELLVSRTVKDLVAGSGIQFTDRGAHSLKGVPTPGSCMRPTPDCASRRCSPGRGEQAHEIAPNERTPPALARWVASN